MTAIRRRPEALRWTICFALALCFHAAGAAALMARWNDVSDQVAGGPVIMIELAALAVAPTATPNELPPGPQQMQTQPELQEPVEKLEKLELQPAPQAELQVTPPPKPLENPKLKKPKQKHTSVASAPSPAEQNAERAAAPAPGANARNSDALADWRSQLVARLERAKRLPSEAPNTAGIARLAFSVDRSGGVHNARIAGSSGSSLLDRETLALLERAQPLPPPPADVAGTLIAVDVPIRYNMR